MKFYVQTLSKRAPRLGVLKELEGRPNLKIQTPVALLHTHSGHIPHITHEVFKLVSKEPQVLQIPLVSMHVYQETMQYYDGGLSSFIGSKDSVTCLTLHDPSALNTQGHHVKGKVPIWTKHGKVLYDPESYMKLVEAFKPDMYYLLSDGDTNKTSAAKRVSKSIENTIYFHKLCLEKHRKSEVLRKLFLMAPIAGGYCLKSRAKCIEATRGDQADISGYLIDGLHNNGPEVEFLPFDEVKSVVEHVIDLVPVESVRSVQGCWNPVNVIKLVQLGVDMFDTSYCYILTERSAAMTFSIDPSEISTSFEINLRNTNYADDFLPILKDCTCLTCSKYSRGYIHHLITVQELLGPVLIMIHNIHHYLRFFKKIRGCIEDGSLDDLETRISEQFTKHHNDLYTKKKVVEQDVFN